MKSSYMNTLHQSELHCVQESSVPHAYLTATHAHLPSNKGPHHSLYIPQIYPVEQTIKQNCTNSAVQGDGIRPYL